MGPFLLTFYKVICFKNTNVNVLSWTQMKVPPTWIAGSSPTPVHTEGLIPHSSGEVGGKRGQRTCANLELWLGADPGKRTAEPWCPS